MDVAVFVEAADADKTRLCPTCASDPDSGSEDGPLRLLPWIALSGAGCLNTMLTVFSNVIKDVITCEDGAQGSC